ncbi:TonB-dependent receptor [Sphingobium baderi]|nr:TonB-dependent receptor plug domain-containing protein [Sphingobium baderi]
MKITTSCSVALMALTMGIAHAQTTPPQAEDAAAPTEFGDIVVTARRTNESAQKVPVTVAAFGNEALREKSIATPQDLQQLTPGVFLGGSGSAGNTVYVIRGQAKPLIGVGQPGALTYFSDVPLPTIASSQPQYDIGNVQVLKGPQGTLFGRNTTGGAVLIYPNAPTYDLGGYLEAGYGNYDWRNLEGAMNLPIAADKVALRVAGRFTKRDGYVENLGVGGDFNNLNSYAFRASLLLEPTEGVKNVTIFDYYHNNDNNQAQIFAGFHDPSIPSAVLSQIRDFTNPTLTSLLAAQQALGKRKTVADIPGFDRTKAYGVTNRTDIELGGMSLTNIFGFRALRWKNQANFDGLPAVDLFGSGVAGPVLNTYRSNAYDQYTEELQLHGTALDDKLKWLVGGFYLKSKPNGENADRADVFNGIGSAVYTFVTEESKALFANASYDLSDALNGMTFNAGFRYTWDKISVCSAAGGSTPPYDGRLGDCKAGTLTNATNISAKFHKPTWTVGFDWQASRDVFAYITSRRGYRAGGVNAPILGPTLAPFQQFAPEIVTDVEAGVKTSWNVGDVRGRFNLSAYYAASDDVQYNVNGLFTAQPCVGAGFDGDCDITNDPSSGAITINAGDISVKGVEATLTVIPTHNLTLNFGGSYIDQKTRKTTYGTLAPTIVAGGEDPAKIPFRFAPSFTGNAGVRYEVPLGEEGTLVANADYYHSAKVLYGIYKAPAYDNVNLRLDWNGVAGSRVDVSAFVRNLFNSTWVQTGGTIAAAPGILTLVYNDPRMYGISLRMRFGAE